MFFRKRKAARETVSKLTSTSAITNNESEAFTTVSCSSKMSTEQIKFEFVDPLNVIDNADTPTVKIETIKMEAEVPPEELLSQNVSDLPMITTENTKTEIIDIKTELLDSSLFTSTDLPVKEEQEIKSEYMDPSEFDFQIQTIDVLAVDIKKEL